MFIGLIANGLSKGQVVQFMYTGLVDLTEDGVWSVLNLADMYHVKLLKVAHPSSLCLAAHTRTCTRTHH
jgi:hypothetical protein